MTFERSELKLKVAFILGTRPEIIRLSKTIIEASKLFDVCIINTQ